MPERKELVNAIRGGIETALANMHTALVARIVKVNGKTIDVQPVVNRFVDGVDRPLPVFVEVPPIFLQGGASHTSYPLAIGDYCLLICAERSTDNWYNGQDEVLPVEPRKHDYSDSFAICGLNNRDGLLTIPSTVERTGDSTNTGDWTHTGNLSLTGDYTHIGNFTLTSGIMDAVDFSAGGVPGVSGSFTQHTGGTITVTKGLITSIT